MGTVDGIVGAEVRGWMGIGEVLGAFWTGVTMGLGDAGAGVASGSAGVWTGD
jgi:hypothetical protein